MQYRYTLINIKTLSLKGLFTSFDEAIAYRDKKNMHAAYWTVREIDLTD